VNRVNSRDGLSHDDVRVGMIFIDDIYLRYISDIYPIFSTLKISDIFDIFNIFTFQPHIWIK